MMVYLLFHYGTFTRNLVGVFTSEEAAEDTAHALWPGERSPLAWQVLDMPLLDKPLVTV